jgi:phosphatidylglycerol lysyltransferase
MPDRAMPARAQRRATNVIMRALVPIAILAVTLPPLADRVVASGHAAVMEALAAVSPAALLAALAATAASFLGVGRYEATVHRWLGTGAGPGAAAAIGSAAVAVSQTLGSGLLTGTLARWRGMPGLPLLGAARVTAAVSVTFMAALAVLVLLAAGGLGLPGGVTPLVLLPGLAVMILAPALSLAPHRFRAAMPPLGVLAALLALAAADVLAAGAAFWLLLPDDPALSFRAVLPAFALALAAGLLSGTPGGVGPFEITLLTLLPEAPQTGLLAGILGFRLVYFALPAILGAAWLALRPTSVPEVGAPPPLSAGRLRAACRAEAGLARQGELAPLGPGGVMLAGITTQAVVAVSDPLAPVAPGLALDMLSAEALRRARRPLLYKCGARLAAEARGRGWTVLAVAEEAWLDPCAFRLDRPKMRGLRRKLRAAEAAGVTVARATALPLTEMAVVAAEWAAARGGERGFSMGRFSPDHVAAQRVWLARAEGRLLGFVTFHQGAREWTLDLVRLRPDAPDGTAHALVAAALAEAARAGLKRLSLAAVPVERPLPRPLERPAAARSGAGLRRFKSAFNPAWEPLYAAAPGRLALGLGLWDVFWRVHRPLPLPTPTMQRAQDDHDEYRLAAGEARVAWPRATHPLTTRLP